MKKYEFKNRNYAFSFAEKCHKLHMVILGDNNMHWVVRMVDAKKLLNRGYEAA